MALSLVAWLLLAAPAAPVVAVVDVSLPDAVYEDVSRALADDVVTALEKAGLSASRVDENELPPEGCRAGPCLEALARARRVQALVVVDATEKGPDVEVSVMALLATNGRPLGAKRFVAGKRAKKALTLFSASVARALEPVDGGRR